MPALTKAELVEVSSGNNPQPVGSADVVQFNPTTLRVQVSNRTAGGQQAGAQARQRPGVAEITVSFELVFDTADEGDDVLRKTSIVDRYVRPQGTGRGQEAPPRVQFTWGSFQVQGTMESANTDIDLFAADGTPLRAKVAVSIKGQDPRWSYQPSPAPPPASGAGSPAQAVNAPALPVGSPGSSGSNQAADKVVQAMPGEGLAQLAARFGLDPGAWRALAAGVDNPMALSLGQEVPLPAKLGGSAASGSAAQGSDPASRTAGLGLTAADRATPAGQPPSPSGNTVRRAPQQAALALTAKGGLGGAIGETRARSHQAGADASLAAFGLAAADTGDSSSRPWGAGVPLRPRFGGGTAAARRDPTLPGWLPGGSATGSGAPATTAPAAKPVGPRPGCGCAKK